MRRLLFAALSCAFAACLSATAAHAQQFGATLAPVPESEWVADDVKPTPIEKKVMACSRGTDEACPFYYIGYDNKNGEWVHDDRRLAVIHAAAKPCHPRVRGEFRAAMANDPTLTDKRKLSALYMAAIATCVQEKIAQQGGDFPYIAVMVADRKDSLAFFSTKIGAAP